MSSPKEIMEGDTRLLDVKFDPTDINESSDDIDIEVMISNNNEHNTTEKKQMPGKEGWLYREIDPRLRVTENFEYTKLWASVCNNRFLFSAGTDVDKMGTFSSFFESARPSSISPCFGYMNLCKGTYVDSLMNRLGSNQKYSFQIMDGAIVVTFGCDKEYDRDQWVEIIRDAINGTLHYLPLSALTVPDNTTKSLVGVTNNETSSSISSSSISVDFPQKSGYLMKSSTGKKTISFRRSFPMPTKRWFKLEAGELRYYSEEKTTFENLKDVFDLKDAQLLTIENSGSDPLTTFELKLANGRILKCDAPSVSEAQAWREAFTQTLSMLKHLRKNNISNLESIPKKTRRYNVFDNVTEEEKLKMLKSLSEPPKSPTNEQSPTKSDRPRFSVANFFKPQQDKNTARSTNTLSDKQSFKSFKTPETVAMLEEVLMQNFLIKRLQDITPLILILKSHVAVPGEIIIWEGSLGDEFYILENGQCEVIKNGIVVGYIQERKSFGELALLDNSVRQATIRVSQLCNIWSFTRQQFRQIAAKQDIGAFTEKMFFLSQIDLFEKLLPSALEKIAHVMELKTFSEGEKVIKQGDIGDCFYMIQSGRVLVTQTSTFEDIITVNSTPKEIIRLGPGKYFGELALLDNSHRKATVTATTLLKCWIVERSTFNQLFGSMSQILNESLGFEILKKVKVLQSLSDSQLEQICRCLVSVNFQEGENIIIQGEVGDSFFLIADGKVSIKVNHIQVATLETGSYFGELALLSNEKRSASVKAISNTHCLVLTREDFKSLLSPLSDLNDEADKRRDRAYTTKRNSNSTNGVLNVLSAPVLPITSTLAHVPLSTLTAVASVATNPINIQKSRSNRTLPPAPGIINARNLHELFQNTSSMFDLSQLDRVRKLGVGTFATVYLVRHIINDKLYSLKVIQKERLKETCQESNAFRERDIMLMLVESQFVTALYATLQDSKSLYFVQQFVPGGDLFTLLYGNGKQKSFLPYSREGGIFLQQAQFYIVNIVVAIHHLQQNEIIHRDLKPENFIVDFSGYLKLTDFGSAKIVPFNSSTHTLCGTPEYIAPEIILSKAYSKSVDFWSLGILAFELLTRSTPFAHPSLCMTYQNIIESEETLKFILSGSVGSSSDAKSAGQTKYLDTNAKDFITGLLRFSVNIRLGMWRDGLLDIWNHPFLKGIGKNKIAEKFTTAPYIPSVDSEYEVRDEDIFDIMNDDDEVPAYSGCYDFSGF